MSAQPDVHVSAELRAALELISPESVDRRDAVTVLSRYLCALAQGLGFSEHGDVQDEPWERIPMDGGEAEVVSRALPEIRGDSDGVRNRLYSAIVGVAQDRASRALLNRNTAMSERRILMAAQIYWNIERRPGRDLLPIPSGQAMVVNGKEIVADIKVPDVARDFATEVWAARCNRKGDYKSSGQGFRTLGARLAVLTAHRLLAEAGMDPSALLPTTREPATVRPVASAMSEVGVAHQAAAAVSVSREFGPDGSGAIPSDRTLRSIGAHGPDAQVMVGRCGDVGHSYQRREVDRQIEDLWAGVGDRRIWLRGVPGVGKSFLARRVVHEALFATTGDEHLIVWVDSADSESVITALSTAVDRMPHLEILIDTQLPDPNRQKALALLEVMATSTWKWLVVLDDAQAGELLDSGFIPPGANPNGRVLITTLSREPRIAHNGRVVEATLFTARESEAFLQAQRVVETGQPTTLAQASTTQLRMLADAVGCHPLALSIAAATVTAHQMLIPDWVAEFKNSPMDEAADAADLGGYPHQIGAAWNAVMSRASDGLPAGVLQRAALVAAVMDTTGHPTWFWEAPEILRWVDPDSASPVRHGRPVVISRLIEFGILELVGGTWVDGRLAIHQLVARAVRETFESDALRSLGAVLLRVWLRSLVRHRSQSGLAVMRGNVKTISTVAHLAFDDQALAESLVAFKTRIPNPLDGSVDDELTLAGRFEKAGALGRVYQAVSLGKVADGLLEIGAADDATKIRLEAISLLQAARDDRALIGEPHAWCLKLLGYALKQAGAEEARPILGDAVEAYTSLVEAETDPKTRVEHMEALIGLMSALGQHGEREEFIAQHRVFARGQLEVARQAYADDESGADWLQLLNLADKQHVWGLISEAQDSLARSKTMGPDVEYMYFERELTWHVDREEWDAVALRLEEREVGDSASFDDLMLRCSVRLNGLDPQFDQQILDRAHGLRSSIVNTEVNAAEVNAVMMQEHREVYDHVVSVLADARAAYRQIRLSQAVEHAESAEMWLAAISLRVALLEEEQGHPLSDFREQERRIGGTLLALSHGCYRDGQYDEAVRHARSAVAIRAMLVDFDPESVSEQRALRNATLIRGMAEKGAGNRNLALDSYAQSVRVAEAVCSLETSSHSDLNDLALVLALMGSLEEKGDHDSARGTMSRRLEVERVIYEMDATGMQQPERLAESLQDIAGYHARGHCYEEAIELASEAVMLHRRVYDEDGATDAQRALARALSLQSMISGVMDRSEEASRAATEAVHLFRELVSEAPGEVDKQVLLANALFCLAGARAKQGLRAEAKRTVVEAAQILRTAVAFTPGEHEGSLLTALVALRFAHRDELEERQADEVTREIDDILRRFPELEAPS